jgi:hypothetical protein
MGRGCFKSHFPVQVMNICDLSGIHCLDKGYFSVVKI